MKTKRVRDFLRVLLPTLLSVLMGCSQPTEQPAPRMTESGVAIANGQSRSEKTDEERVAEAVQEFDKLSSASLGLRIIRQMGPRAKGAVPFLVTLLAHDDWRMRERAAEALGYIGPAAEDAIPALIATLGDTSFSARRQSGLALAKIGSKAVPALVSALSNESPTVRWKAAEAIGAIAPPAENAVPALIVALNDEHNAVRQNAAQALGNIGPAGGNASSALHETMRDENIRVAVRAAGALARIDPDAEQALAFLVLCLQNERDGGVREWAAQELGQLRWHADRALLPLAEALADDYREVQIAAAKSLGHIGPDAAEATSALVETLEDNDSGVRREATITLGLFGPSAKEAVPALVRTLYDKERTVRASAAHALGRIGSEAREAVPSLLELLIDGKEVSACAEALGRIDLHAEGVVAALIGALDTPNKTDQQEIASILASGGARTLPALTEVLDNHNVENRRIRKGVILALTKIGEPAVPTLKAALENEDMSTRLWASDALQAIKGLEGTGAAEEE